MLISLVIIVVALLVILVVIMMVGWCCQYKCGKGVAYRTWLHNSEESRCKNSYRNSTSFFLRSLDILEIAGKWRSWIFWSNLNTISYCSKEREMDTGPGNVPFRETDILPLHEKFSKITVRCKISSKVMNCIWPLSFSPVWPLLSLIPSIQGEQRHREQPPDLKNLCEQNLFSLYLNQTLLQ